MRTSPKLPLWFCVLIVVGAIGKSLSAQQVHAVIVGDVSPAAQWGKYLPNIQLDLVNMTSLMTDNMPFRQLDMLRLELEEDAASDPANVLSAIEQMQVSPSDSLVFYFSGHGASDDSGHHLLLAKGKLPREKLRSALEAKGARLTLLITDCCNVRSDGYAYLAPAAPPRQLSAPTILFSALVLQPSGIVDINSCSPGESAFFTPHDPDMNELPGSIFTKELAKWFTAHQNQTSTWDQLVRGVGLQTHQAFHDYYPKGVDSPDRHMTQLQQNVYALAYPGMPEKKGPRTGMLIRDFNGQGAVITQVAAESPAAQVFVVGKNAFAALKPQQVIVAVQGNAVTNTQQVGELIAQAPQIVRLTIRESGHGDFDVLMRMRY